MIIWLTAAAAAAAAAAKRYATETSNDYTLYYTYNQF